MGLLNIILFKSNEQNNPIVLFVALLVPPDIYKLL